jgi:CMP-N-acetylneuraminic acid synthetase
MNEPDTLTVLAIIPARGGSKGVPRKNIRTIAGKPLIAYTIETAKQCSLLTELVVSTDDSEIATIAATCGASVLMRPPELASDTTPMVPVVKHALESLMSTGGSYDYIILLQPTAPLRKSHHIDEALMLLHNTGADSVVSVAPVPRHYHPYWQFIIEGGRLELFTGQPLGAIVTRRQELPATYTRNGAIYACKTKVVMEHGEIYGSHCVPYVMLEDESVNIDSEADLLLAERLLLAEKIPRDTLI